MKTIIVPIDFSVESLTGLKMAITIANKISAHVTLVHVLKDLSKKVAIIKFEDIIKKNKKKLKTGELTYKIHKGKIYREVVNQAKYDEAVLIVSSTHGASGFEEFFIGSNAYKIVSSSECPVLTIRKGTNCNTISTIVLPIDRSRDSRQKVPFTATMAELFNSTIHIVGVADDFVKEAQKELKPYIKQVEKYLDERGIKHVSDFKSGKNLADVIIEYSKDVKADLISIMTDQEESFANILLGAYAQQLVNHSPIPVLSCHASSKTVTDGFHTMGSTLN